MRRYHHEPLVKMGRLQKQVPEPEGWGSGVQACLETFWNISCNISWYHVLVCHLGTLLYFHRLILLFALIWHSSVPKHEPLLEIEFFFHAEIVLIITTTINQIFIHNYVAYITVTWRDNGTTMSILSFTQKLLLVHIPSTGISWRPFWQTVWDIYKKGLNMQQKCMWEPCMIQAFTKNYLNR